MDHGCLWSSRLSFPFLLAFFFLFDKLGPNNSESLIWPIIMKVKSFVNKKKTRPLCSLRLYAGLS